MGEKETDDAKRLGWTWIVVIGLAIVGTAVFLFAMATWIVWLLGF